ncbi:MAG: phosphotransferase enzyme family protein [Spirochaetota bacterium]
MLEMDDITAALAGFPETRASAWAIRPHGAGRIHGSWAVRPAEAPPDSEPVYLLQKLNLAVFPDYELLMRNAVTISRHVESSLEFVRAEGDADFVRDGEGRVFRLLRFVPNSVPAGIPPSLPEAREAAIAFGEFDAALASLDPSLIAPTIPGFHDTPARYRRLVSSAGASDGELRDTARRDLAWFAERAGAVGFVADNLGSDELPLRVCHNDTKADNVLLDRDTRRRLCVVDYDTVMPGSPLYDVGDLLRSAAPTVGEDDPDPSAVDVRWDAATTIVDGFIEGAGSVLTPRERELATASGWLFAMEQGIRYLTDYLEGEHYYPVDYAGQSLDRARNQVALAAAFERGGWAPVSARRTPS